VRLYVCLPLSVCMFACVTVMTRTFGLPLMLESSMVITEKSQDNRSIDTCNTDTPRTGYAKTAEPTEILFGKLTQVGPGNHVLDGGPHPAREWAVLRGVGPMGNIVTVSCTIMAKRSIRAIHRRKALALCDIHVYSSLGDRHLREISDLILYFFRNKQQNTRRCCKRLSKRFGVTLQPMTAHA